MLAQASWQSPPVYLSSEAFGSAKQSLDGNPLGQVDAKQKNASKTNFNSTWGIIILIWGTGALPSL